MSTAYVTFYFIKEKVSTYAPLILLPSLSLSLSLYIDFFSAYICEYNLKSVRSLHCWLLHCATSLLFNSSCFQFPKSLWSNYIYIYIYIYREREREREGASVNRAILKTSWTVNESIYIVLPHMNTVMSTANVTTYFIRQTCSLNQHWYLCPCCVFLYIVWDVKLPWLNRRNCWTTALYKTMLAALALQVCRCSNYRHVILFVFTFVTWKGQLVEALFYKPKGGGFDSRCGHWNFSLT
jgi:hypothetical protein